MNKLILSLVATSLLGVFTYNSSQAQTPPSKTDYAQYNTFLKAVYDADIETVNHFIKQGVDLEQRDSSGRTAIHIAVFGSNEFILKRLVQAGSDINALEFRQYDAVTIAAVANDLDMLKIVLDLGGNSKNTTSPYDGTALIAAAHLGHVEVVKALLAAGSNIDHTNNLNWTALLEAIILGDGGSNHIAVVKALLSYNADKTITDAQGGSPISHARQRGYSEMVKLLLETKY
jgi:ankyrin repeat protein